MDDFSHPEDIRQIQLLRTRLENVMDFIAWLFETELSYTDESEMWDKYEKENEDKTIGIGLIPKIMSGSSGSSFDYDPNKGINLNDLK